MKKILVFSLIGLSLLSLSGGKAKSVYQRDNAYMIQKANPRVNAEYSSYNGQLPNLPVFGEGKFAEGELCGSTKVVTRQGWWSWDTERTEMPKYATAIYLMSKKLNVCVRLLKSEKIHLFKGESCSYTITTYAGMTTSYENEATYEVSSKLSCTEAADAGLKIADIGLTGKVSYTSEVQAKVSEKVKQTTTTVQSTTTSVTYSWTADDIMYVGLQVRADFFVYNVQVYEISYPKETRTKRIGYPGGYRNAYYTYTPVYKLIENNMKYTYVDGTSADGFYKFSKYDIAEYDDFKNENTIYL